MNVNIVRAFKFGFQTSDPSLLYQKIRCTSWIYHTILLVLLVIQYRKENGSSGLEAYGYQYAVEQTKGIQIIFVSNGNNELCMFKLIWNGFFRNFMHTGLPFYQHDICHQIHGRLTEIPESGVWLGVLTDLNNNNIFLEYKFWDANRNELPMTTIVHIYEIAIFHSPNLLLSALAHFGQYWWRKVGLSSLWRCMQGTRKFLPPFNSTFSILNWIR